MSDLDFYWIILGKFFVGLVGIGGMCVLAGAMIAFGMDGDDWEGE